MGKLKDMGYAVKLDTNGSFPDRLRELVEAGLVDYVAMDIKGALENYGRITGVADFDTAPIRKARNFCWAAACLMNSVPQWSGGCTGNPILAGHWSLAGRGPAILFAGLCGLR